MATWFDDYWTALKSAVTAAWPEVQPGSLSSSIQAGKRDWPNLLNTGQVSPPLVVIDVSFTAATDADGAPVDWPGQVISAVVYYMAADDAVDGGSVKMLPFLVGRMIALSHSLLKSTGFPGTVNTEMTFDANATNPLEAALTDADQRFTAASLGFTVLIVDDTWQT